MKKEDVILIGYRGVGKSTIAGFVEKRISSLLNWDTETLSLDQLLASRVGNLQRFIQDEGWGRFREEEKRLIRELQRKAKVSIIDCGGGVVESSENMEELQKLGKIFYLYASVDVLRNRLTTTTARLTLSHSQSFIEEVEKILKERDPLYRKYADFIVETDSLSAQESAEIIVQWMMKNNWLKGCRF